MRAPWGSLADEPATAESMDALLTRTGREVGAKQPCWADGDQAFATRRSGSVRAHACDAHTSCMNAAFTLDDAREQ